MKQKFPHSKHIKCLLQKKRNPTVLSKNSRLVFVESVHKNEIEHATFHMSPRTGLRDILLCARIDPISSTCERPEHKDLQNSGDTITAVKYEILLQFYLG